MTSGWADDIIGYWFDHLGPKHWFTPNDDVDEEIRERFEPLWNSLRHEAAIFFLTEPREALAATILFDQFPRNIFRDEADSLATDPLALGIAKGALEAGYDAALQPDKRAFLYMPFMHSERLADQDRSVELFDALGNKNMLDYAILHRGVIARFGRFPHRNEILGRESTPAEAEALTLGPGW